MNTALWRYKHLIGLSIVLAILLAFYIPTFQTIINGSDDLKMIDVGETQIVLNTWGTLHSTGYPHYVITGNLLRIVLRAMGFSAVVSPALVSLFWGVLSLILLYLLFYHLTEDIPVTSAIVLLYGLTRFVWLHNVIAEIYSFTLFLLILLVCLALWRDYIPNRISWMALLGGIGLAHHRTIVLAIPALLVAVWPMLWPMLKARLARLLTWLGLGVLGFVPYLYLPLRASASADWVYGEPDSLQGFLDQFNGTEAGYLFGLPESQEALTDNFERINALLVDELSIWGLLAGIAGLLLVMIFQPHQRRTGLMLIVLALVNYSFAVVLYYDILASIILAITLVMAAGWAFLLRQIKQIRPDNQQVTSLIVLLPVLPFAFWLNDQNAEFIYDLTHNKEGLRTIELVEQAPPDSTVMLAWGPRYFAVGFAHDVQDRLQHIKRHIDHKGDFTAVVQDGPLVTPWYTLFNQSVDWWEQRLGQPVYLQAVGPELVEIGTMPELMSPEQVAFLRQIMPYVSDVPVTMWDYTLSCTDEQLILTVEWLALEKPSTDVSVFVHLVGSVGQPPLAQGDQPDPVYGWRPVSTWHQGERVKDVYILERDPAGTVIQFGFYDKVSWQERYSEIILPVHCGE